MTTKRSCASSVTSRVTSIVLLNVIVPLKQQRTKPPIAMAFRNSASLADRYDVCPDAAVGNCQSRRICRSTIRVTHSDRVGAFLVQLDI